MNVYLIPFERKTNSTLSDNHASVRMNIDDRPTRLIA